MLSLSDRYSDGFGIANASQIIAVTAPAPENSLSLRGQNYLLGSPSSIASLSNARAASEPSDTCQPNETATAWMRADR